MKKLINLIVCICLFSICKAQTTGNHITFKGISLGKNLTLFVSEMKKIGFVEQEMHNVGSSVMMDMKGEFMGRDCEISVGATPQTKLVWAVSVSFEKGTSWYSLKSDYNEIKTQYIQKYGTPTKDFVVFKKPYYEGDGYEISALKQEKCVYFVGWEIEYGYIAIEITKYARINIFYQDKLTGEKKELEEDRQIQNEI